MLYPGIASNLSSVPPVCPNPLPEIIGTYKPHAAKRGASIKLTLSPTPPVECLSHTSSGLDKFFHVKISPECVMHRVSSTVSSLSIPLRRIAMLIAAICESENSPDVIPSTKIFISSLDSLFLSLLALIISCGIMKINVLNIIM